MRDLAFAAIWALLIPLNIASARVGVYLWEWVALLSPNELLYGFMVTVPFNKIVAILTLVMMFIGREQKDPYWDRSLFLLTLFGVSVTISWATAIFSTSENQVLYEKVAKELVLVFVITVLVTTRAHIDRLVLVMAVSLGFLAVKEGSIFILSAGGHLIAGSGGLGDNNGLAAALVMLIPLLVYLIQHSVMKVVRLGLLATLGLCVVTIIATNSRGGFVGLLVLGLFMITNSRHKLISLFLVATAGILVYSLAPDTWFNRIDTINKAGDDTSFMTRVVAWKISFLLAMDHPWFGGGMHAIQNASVWNHYRLLYDPTVFIDTPPAGTTPRAAHSIFFEIVGDLGFVGLTLFLGFLTTSLWYCRWIYRNCSKNLELLWAADLARMLQISLIVYFVTGAALSNGYYEQVYIIVALVSRCRRTVQLAIVPETSRNKAMTGRWQMAAPWLAFVLLMAGVLSGIQWFFQK